MLKGTFCGRTSYRWHVDTQLVLTHAKLRRVQVLHDLTEVSTQELLNYYKVIGYS